MSLGTVTEVKRGLYFCKDRGDVLKSIFDGSNARGVTHTVGKKVTYWTELCTFYYLRIENAEGNVLITVYLFIYLFVCVLLA